MRKNFPFALKLLVSHHTWHDSLDSTKDNDSAIQLFQELQSLWNKVGMKARKWLNNSPELLSAFPQELRALEIDVQHNALPVTKTLGILRNAQEDVFSFRVTTPEMENILTKRFIVGRVAEVFDPQAKILSQDLWIMGLGWDDPITHEISIRAKECFLELEELMEIKVPRSLREPNLERCFK